MAASNEQVELLLWFLRIIAFSISIGSIDKSYQVCTSTITGFAPKATYNFSGCGGM
ncbi:MAG: hypothetical protein MZV64_16130 [Ignavibacteriales bacterium]|nr:hypothetical protein [Ignavibacteriales bacterium]